MSNLPPPEEPRMKLGHGVDVMELNIKSRTMGLRVHVVCWEHELQTDVVTHKIRESVKRAIKYLIDEGFIASEQGWHIAVAVLGHPPKE